MLNRRWQSVAREASRRCYSSGALTRPTALPCRNCAYPPQLIHSHSPLAILRPTAATRHISVSAVRRREKSSSQDEEGNNEGVQEKRREVAEEGDSLDVKGKSSEPTPIPTGDGKGASAAGAGGDGSSSGGGEGGGRGKKKGERGLVKPQVPEVYPQVMAIPIAQRPLFPGFYKAITIRDQNVISAVNELLKMGQSYVGAFLLKDPESSKDVIDSMDEVYDVGTFCQITGAFQAGHGEEKALQAVLYPHRRIKLTELMPPNRSGSRSAEGGSKVAKATIEPAVSDAQPASKEAEQPKPQTPAQAEKQGDVVASFEEQGNDQSQQKQQLVHYEPTSFLRNWPVSLVKVENLQDEPVDKRSPTVRALVSEIVNTCKEIGLSLIHI